MYQTKSPGGGGGASTTDQLNNSSSIAGAKASDAIETAASELTTGWIGTPPIISINADPSKFDYTSGLLRHVDITTNPVTVTETVIAAATGITPAFLASNSSTKISFGTGGINQTNTQLSNTDRRDYAEVGLVSHIDSATIDAVLNEQTNQLAALGQLHDLYRAIGFFSKSGNQVAGIASGLTISKSAGVGIDLNVNSNTNKKDPHAIIMPALSPVSLFHVLRDGSLTSNGINTVIDPTVYDNGGVETTVPANNNATIAYVYAFPNNSILYLLGQQVFSTFADAKDAAGSETVVLPNDVADDGLLLARVIMKKTATDITDAGEAFILPSSTIAGGGATQTSLQGGYDISVQPEIITNAVQGSIDIQGGTGTDSDKLQTWKNNAGVEQASINGEGKFTGDGSLLTNVSGDLFDIAGSQLVPKAGRSLNAESIVGASGANFAPTGDDISGDVDRAAPNDTISTEVSYDTDHWVNDVDSYTWYNTGTWSTTDAAMRGTGAKTICVDWTQTTVLGTSHIYSAQVGNHGVVAQYNAGQFRVYVGDGSTLDIVNGPAGIDDLLPHRLIIIIPLTGPFSFWVDGVEYTGSVSLTSGLTNTGVTESVWGAATSGLVQPIRAEFRNILYIDGEATNPASYDGTFASLTGSLTLLLDAPDGNPDNSVIAPVMSWTKGNTVDTFNIYPVTDPYTDYHGGMFSSGDASVKAGGTAKTLAIDLKFDVITAPRVVYYNRSGGDHGGMYIDITGTTVRFAVGSGAGTEIFSLNGLSTDVWYRFVLVVPLTGFASLWVDGVETVGSTASMTAGMSPNTNATASIGSLTPGSQTFDGQIRNLFYMDGEVTNPGAYDGNRGSLEGSLTDIINARDGNPNNATPTIVWTETSGFTTEQAGNNWIPYEVLPNPSSQLNTATLVVKDELGVAVNSSNFNAMYSTDGGTTNSGFYDGASFLQIGLLPTSTNFRIFIQPIDGQKIGSIEIWSDLTVAKLTADGFEILKNSVRKWRVNLDGQEEMDDSTEPTTPSDGLTTYSENSILKYKGASGVVSTVLTDIDNAEVEARLTSLENRQGVNTLRNAAANGFTVQEYIDAMADEYEDSTGVDDAITTASYDSLGKFFVAPNASNSLLLMHFDGADLSTTFTDSSSNNRTATPVSGAKISTGQSVFGGASGLFNGSTDYLTYPDSPDWDFGSDDWKIAFRMRPTNLSGVRVVCGRWGSAGQQSFMIGTNGSELLVQISENGTSAASSTTTSGSGIAINNWYAVEVSRTGNNIYVWLDGTLIEIIAYSGSFFASNQPLVIGAQNTGTSSWSGNIDELIIDTTTPGHTGVLTDVYAVETEAYSTALVNCIVQSRSLLPASDTDQYYDNVELLIHSDGAHGSTNFNDSSSNNYTITANGDVAHSNTDPYFGSTAISYDGTGDYLSVADSDSWNFGAGDWTIEMWLKLDGTGVSDNLYTQRSDANNRFNFQIDPNVIAFFAVSGGSTVCSYSYTGADALLSTNWNHIALVRSGTNIYLFVNGASITLSVTTAIASQSLPDIAAPLILGARGDGASNFLAGDRQELRVTKGVARYTTPFTIPSAIFPNQAAVAPSYSPVNAGCMVLLEPLDAFTENTDLIVYVTRDGGTTLTAVNLTFYGMFNDTVEIWVANDTDISGQPEGDDMKYRVQTFNTKQIEVHGFWLFWR